jgi:hypothetical protein
MRRPALKHADTLTQGIAASWSTLRLARKDRLASAEVVARVQQLEHVLLGRVPTLDLVVITPVGLVRIVGLAIAELRELGGERFHVLIGIA